MPSLGLTRQTVRNGRLLSKSAVPRFRHKAS